MGGNDAGVLDPESIGEERLSSVCDTEFGFPLVGGNDEGLRVQDGNRLWIRQHA